MTQDESQMPAKTPWGKPQHVQTIAPGIILVSTSTHGGFWLSPEQNKKIPEVLKKNTFGQNGLKGWYEEDEDAAIVRQAFPQYFGSKVQDE